MARFRVNHRYSTDRRSLEAGQVVELDEAEADFIENDSPGCLTREKAAPAPEEGAARAPVSPPSDRRQRTRGRRDAETI